MADKPTVTTIRKETAPLEIKEKYEEIQDTMGVPWVPANWQAYAVYPLALNQFWKALKPAVQSESFLEDALEITARAYSGASEWYQSDLRAALTQEEQKKVARELDAFEFGNPQLLIQQHVLTRALQGEAVGQTSDSRSKRAKSPYRQPKISMIEEEVATADIKEIYDDVKETLGLSVVNSDYKALAKWPEFFAAAWQDVKKTRGQSEYKNLQQEITRMAQEAAERIPARVEIQVTELQEKMIAPGTFEKLQKLVTMFTELLPGLIINDALFRVAVAGGEPVAPPQAR